MDKELSILLLEDNPGDGVLIEQALRSAGIDHRLKRVETREAFQAALQAAAPDLILSDYRLPSFTGVEALKVVRDQYPEIPFIFVTGAMGEELAIETLKQGAADYVLKDHLARLAPAVRRAMQESSLRASNKHSEEALRESRNYLDAIINAIADPVYVKDSRHRYVLVNEAFVEFAGRPREEIIGRTPADFLFPHEAKASQDQDDRVLKTGKKDSVEVQTQDAARRVRIVNEIKTLHVNSAGERYVVGCMRDVTERARIEDALREGGVQLSRALLDVQAAQAELKAQNEELRRAQEIIRDSRDYLDSIINAIADPVFVKDARHRYVMVNVAFAEFLGLARDKIIGKMSADFFFSRAAEVFLTQDDKVLETGEKKVVEVEVRDGAGRERIVSAIKTLHRSADGERFVVGCLQDVTEARTSEQVAQRARQEWERTFNAVPDLVAVLDNKHRIRRVNKAMAQRLGLSPEACAGRSCHDTVHGNTHPADACPHAFTCADGQEHFVEVHEPRLGGDFLVSTTPVFDERGQVAGSVHVARDITEAKRTEADLHEAAKLREDLMSLINHEYANGLTNMTLALTLLRCSDRGTPDEGRSHSYEVLERSLGKLKSYTANFLNLHRMESGKFELALQPIAVRAVLLDDLVTLRPLAEGKRQDLTLRTDFPDDLPVAVRADPDCLSLIVNNLVTNAIKYTPEGGRISILVSLEKGPPARVRFTVEDTGMGLSERDRERILSGPYRTDQAKAAARGFGVGLVLVRQFLQKHDSRLEIASVLGKGSRFSFSLPVWTEAPAAQTQAPAR